MENQREEDQLRKGVQESPPEGTGMRGGMAKTCKPQGKGHSNQPSACLVALDGEELYTLKGLKGNQRKAFWVDSLPSFLSGK